MRLVAVFVAVVLVNLPLAHQAWTERRIADRGQLVEAVVTDAQVVRGRNFVDYRLPKSVDPEQTTFSARLDDATYAVARDVERLEVRVVPGEPEANRAVGDVGNSILLFIALFGDAILLLFVATLFVRGRRWSKKEVLYVEGDRVTFTMADQTLTARVPAGWARTLQPGEFIRGDVHLEAAGDIYPGLPVDAFDQVDGATWLVRGRVSDVDRFHADLQLSNGYELKVLVGPHRNRADLREHGEVTGTLVLTPR